jgi:uncharacterized protein DUF6249
MDNLLAPLIPIAAILGGLGFAAYAITIKARVREMHHRERLAMIEKGMTPPPLPTGRERDYPTHTRRGSGILCIFVGLGLAFLLGYGDHQGIHGYAVGAFVALIGVAMLINSILDSRSLRDSNPSRPDSHPPAM